MRCPKCRGEEKAKNGFKKGIQRYKCKRCGCNYTKSTPHGYPIEVKREALRYYLEGMGFRRIERLPEISHTAVIYRAKKAGEKIKDIAFEERKAEKVDVLELDEMCVSFKKIEQKMDTIGSRESFSENTRILCGLS